MHPRLILIFGWMNGALVSVKKYASRYHAMYPYAVQLVVLSRSSASWTTKSANISGLLPAVEFLKKTDIFSSETPHILVHVFSNGGASQLILLSELLEKVSVQPSVHPTACFILDSLPGSADLRAGLNSYTAAIQPFYLKILASIPLTVLYLVIMGTDFFTGRPNPARAILEGLDRPELLPGIGKTTPRTYIYSDADKIANLKYVEEHIGDAWGKGFNVAAERFNNSPHVGHAKQDAGRYWGIVSDAWQQALKAKL
ncbi:hypothetical protein C8R44DRAFT_694210 [Mycena epipterygia]|nr:hypothetical protein C8R44DRAFT_694202 [Mycena epipterygia]KAJ7139640.1 hypothetical protein C8R44DRAFT_694210 [Mycena epipterygia]